MAILSDSAFMINDLVTGGKVERGLKSNDIIGVAESTEMAAIDIVVQSVLPSKGQSVG